MQRTLEKLNDHHTRMILEMESSKVDYESWAKTFLDPAMPEGFILAYRWEEREVLRPTGRNRNESARETRKFLIIEPRPVKAGEAMADETIQSEQRTLDVQSLDGRSIPDLITIGAELGLKLRVGQTKVQMISQILEARGAALAETPK